MENKGVLKVNAYTLGLVSEVSNFLYDIEYAYNSIYTFLLIVDSWQEDSEKRIKALYKKFRYIENESKGFHRFYMDELYTIEGRKFNILENYQKIDFKHVVSDSDKLVLSKVNIQSPGFWEFVGSLNPLEVLRNFLNDRHERSKDNQYQNAINEALGVAAVKKAENEVISQRIEILKNAGFSEIEIREFVHKAIVEPLNKLDGHINAGRIDDGNM